MKTTAFILSLCAAAAVAEGGEYVNVVIQTQLDTRVEHLTYSSETDYFSVAPIPAAGSKFELWAIDQTTGEEYLIDVQYVSALFANSTISVDTGDPCQRHRTRVDQNIEVTIQVNGLNLQDLQHADLGLGFPDPADATGDVTSAEDTAVVDASLDGDGTSVLVTSTKDLSNVVLLFTDGTEEKTEGLSGYEATFSGTGENAGKKIVGVWIKSGNNSSGDGSGYGEYVDQTFNPDPDHNTTNNIDEFVSVIDPSKVLLIQKSYSYPEDSDSVVGGELNDQILSTTTISTEGPTKLSVPAASLPAGDKGEVVLTVAALAGQEITESILDAIRVQIWPVATGAISGIDTLTEYANLPTVTVTLEDLYPSSTTYLRIYPGSPAANPVDFQKESASVVIIDDIVPHDRILTLRNLDKQITKHGIHTLEVVHETPFGQEVLAQQTIRVDRRIEFAGTIYTIE